MSTATTAASSALPSTATSAAPPPPPPLLQPTLPSAAAQRQVAEARAALVASLGNMVDSELKGRAGELHANAAALARQERDVERATAALRRDVDRLAREAAVAARRVKELGSVQNWAEVLHRDFLLLHDTYDRARARARVDHPSDDDNAGSESASGSDECGSQCSCGRRSDDGAAAASASSAGPARQSDEAVREREEAVLPRAEVRAEVRAERAEQEQQEEGETMAVDGDLGKGVAVDSQIAVVLPQMASMSIQE